MVGKKANVEPQKLGGQVHVGSNTFMADVFAYQATYPPGPPNAPAGQGSYNGLNQSVKLDKVGPGIDALNVPAGYIGFREVDSRTSETHFTWPEAVVPGVAQGWHVQGVAKILNTDANGTIGPDVQTTYRIPFGQVVSAQVTTLLFRLQNGFINPTIAGDMPNRFSPFLSPGTELIMSNVGILQVVGGGALNQETSAVSAANTNLHSFSQRIKSKRELKVDDTIVLMVRVRSLYDSFMSRPPVVAVIDCTGFYVS